MGRTGSARQLIITHNDRSIKSDHMNGEDPRGEVSVWVTNTEVTITLSTDLAMPRLNEAFTQPVGSGLLWDQHFHRGVPR